MEQIISFFITNTLPLLLLLPILIILHITKTNNSHHPPPSHPLPPSPPPIPIVGHLHLLSLPLHRSLSRLASLHRNSPLLLRLGSRPALLISSSSAARQSLADLSFANRPLLPSTGRLSYNFTTLVASPYGPHLRNLRRIANAHIFSPAKLTALSLVARQEIARMTNDFAGGGGGGWRKVGVRERLDDMVMDVVMRMVVGRGCGGEERGRLRWVVREGFELVRESWLGDFLPFLRGVGRKGREKRMVRLEKVADEMLQKMVEEVRGREVVAGEERTVVDCLLELQDKDGEYYTDDIIKGLILVLSFFFR